jgi:hypothetical protein
MSSPLAIAAVTATLRSILVRAVTADTDLADTTVTTLPPDKARDAGNTANQLNLFLYLTKPSAAWRNADPPGRVQPGESAFPPLALNLFYLITAYGRDNDAVRPFSHELIGRAMSLLHDHPVLGPDEIRGAFPASDLFNQVERVRFTLQPLSGEEVFNLWSSFQTQYRLSVAYEAAVVLIDSARRVRAPLPVLTRGREDSGITAQASATPAFPAIETMELPKRQSAVQLGDVIKFSGHDLAAAQVKAVFETRRLAKPVRLDPEPGATAEEVSFRIKDDPALWAPGVYTVQMELTDDAGTPDERTRTSNQVPVAIAPTITTTFPVTATIAGGSATVSLSFRPRVLPDQAAFLLLGDREIPAAPRTAAAGKLQFPIPNAVPGEYLARLRVDGADSLLVDASGSRPVFRDQKVILR